MRLIKLEEKEYYDPLIVTGNCNKIVEALNKDFLYDILCLLEEGENIYKYIVDDKDIEDIVQGIYANGSNIIMREEELKLFQLKIDLLDFLECDFFKELYADGTLLLKEKFDILLNILNSLLELEENANDSDNWEDGTPNETTDRIEAKTLKNTAEEAVIDGNGGEEILSIMDKKEFSRMVGKTGDMFKGFSALFNYFKPPGKRKNFLYNYSSGKSLSNRKIYRELLQNKEFIKKIVNKLFTEKDLYIFHFANAMKTSFQKSGKTKLKESKGLGSNLHFKKMKNNSDINKIVPGELVSPLLDNKIMGKNARIKGYKKRNNEQQALYLLLDHSGSTQDLNRLLFIKSLAIALGKKAWEEKSPFFVRWFDDKCESLFELKEERDWSLFLDYILDIGPEGGTALEKALKIAIEDIEKAKVEDLKNVDILLISDGTTDINYYYNELKDKKKSGLKLHFLFLEEGRRFDNIKLIADSFNIMDTSAIMDYAKFNPKMRTIM